jgi:hypothetical protein
MLTLEKRFLQYVKKTDNCWIWVGYTFPCKGERRGRINVKGKLILVNRLSYQLYVGPLQDSDCVLHTCDNGLCVRPDHLYIGDRSDNARDRVERNRSAMGERNGNAKLTADDVVEIRRSVDGNRELARRFHVTHKTIAQIRNNETWKNVQELADVSGEDSGLSARATVDEEKTLP